jgi:chromosome segregation ATPase
MKTPEKILLDLLENSGVVNAVIQKYPEFERSIIKAMEEYSVQCVETASFSSDRLQEITESKVEELQDEVVELQEKYESEQERNSKLIELNDLLKTTLYGCRSQIDHMNTAYCEGKCESATMAVKTIDRLL